MEQITVRLPASTSNLGAGFDCLGVALRLYNAVTIKRGTSRDHHPPIVSQAADRFFRQASLRAFRFSCSIAEEVPRSRGLGSSATIRAGVLIALNRVNGDPLERSTIFRLCAELEGHPDNAAPSIFGGFTVVARMERNAALRRLVGAARRRQRNTPPDVRRFAVSSRLHFVVFVPQLEIATARARKVLPSKISHAAATENCANACAATAAFVSRNYAKLQGTFTDRLHQPFRAKLVPFLPLVIRAAEQAGALGAFLSGSGSSIAAVTLHSSRKIADAMLRAANTPGRIIITQADNHGAQIST
jgi:homoserine kinase